METSRFMFLYVVALNKTSVYPPSFRWVKIFLYNQFVYLSSQLTLNLIHAKYISWRFGLVKPVLQ